MSAPYWGQLPPSKTGQTKTRRLSDDVNAAADRHQSLDVPLRSNRVSVQTTKSDAPTESTMSPFASPTASSFQGQGLAPRPPSLPYGANQYPPELAENRRRRRRSNQEQEQEYGAVPAAPPLPAAPEVPRAPPVSYKHPGSAVTPTPYTSSPRGSKQMEAEEYIKASTPVSQREDHPVLDRASNTLDARVQRNVTDPTANHRRSSSGADQLLQNRKRRASGNQPSDRSRMFADDRSPLQRLELTLDSISKEDKLSKEEKRARAEAAERAMRERGVSGGANPSGERSPIANEARFRTSGIGEVKTQSQPPLTPVTPVTPVTPTRPIQPGSAQHGPLSQNPPDEVRRYPLVRAKSPRNRTQDSRIPVPISAPSTSIPQRNLSFRERAAKGDIKPPVGLEEGLATDASSPGTPQQRNAPVARSGSNKLKKNPPEPWPPRESLEPLPQVAPRPDRTRGTEKPEYKPPPRRADPGDDDVVLTPPSVGKLVKNPSQRKAEQSFGHGVPHVGWPSTHRNTASPPARGPGSPPQFRPRRDHRSDSESDEDNRHVSDLVYHAREKLKPGRGVFQPSEYLDEWKQATIGTLSGALIDLEDVPPVVEKGTPWWENTQSSSRRRSSMSARPKRAEAFEGEYDDTNGMRFLTILEAVVTLLMGGALATPLKRG